MTEAAGRPEQAAFNQRAVRRQFILHEVDDAWLIECTEASYIHDAVMKMPMGYETLIGELGEGLPGGQKQRLFIARALYRKPCILFMAEATSALDADSQRCVNPAIRQLRIIRIIIAHRESAIATADKVLSLNVTT